MVINGSWGLGEQIVAGHVEPDEWVVFKPGLDGTTPDGLARRPIIDRVRGSKLTKMVYATGEAAATKVVDTRRRERETYVLSDDEVLQLARWATAIERHYSRPMDVEWAKDGESGELFVVQARPETVQSRVGAGALTSYRVETDETPVVRGIAVGSAVATGRVRVLTSAEDADEFEDGDVLVTEMTDPDWGPIMARASAIVTDRGGRTAHAAIISRELGLPAVVGSDDATRVLEDGEVVTVSCAEGDAGLVYRGEVQWVEDAIDVSDIPETDTKVMLILASPGAAMRWWQARHSSKPPPSAMPPMPTAGVSPQPVTRPCAAVAAVDPPAARAGRLRSAPGGAAGGGRWSPRWRLPSCCCRGCSAPARPSRMLAPELPRSTLSSSLPVASIAAAPDRNSSSTQAPSV